MFLYHYVSNLGAYILFNKQCYPGNAHIGLFVLNIHAMNEIISFPVLLLLSDG